MTREHRGHYRLDNREPVAATPGVAGGYQLGAGASLPPLQLEDDEALAVSIGLGIVTRGPTPYDGDAEVRLDGDVVEELEAVLAAL